MELAINENQLHSDPELPLDEADNTENTLSGSVRSRFLWPFRDSTFGLGLLLLSISAGVFLLYDFFSSPKVNDANTILFMLHYGLALTMSLVLYRNGFLKFREQHYPDGRSARWMGMLLWLISAYALNREIPVFQQSTEWLCWALVLVSGTMVLYTWKEELPVRIQQLLYAVLAFGWWLFAYMAIYMIPLYLISVPMLIGLGLSIHSFVPLLFAVVVGKRLWHDAKREEHVRLGIGIGLSVPPLILALFLSGWIRDLNHMEEMHMESTIRKTSDLPDWVLIAQRIQSDGVVSQWITNRLLLSNRVFDQGQFFNGRGWGLTGLTAFDDVRQHDPLVVIASQLFPTDVLSNADQLALLKVLSSNRHRAEEKLWTGRHLTTEAIVSQVHIWPQFRVSYTEQTLRIRNQARNATEEALMTFHLPAGSVVSSMSLWVNGREEPARLTTVTKADSAYRTIVGVESQVVARDPSVVYWQEANRVTVRVFPCRAGEDRRVKLGITSPLLLTGNQLIYQTPTIEGPDVSSANELIHVEFASSPADLKTPWFFDKLQGRILTHKGSYEPNWSLRFQAPVLLSDAFLLNHKAYQVEPLKPASESFTPTDIYIDINQSWTKHEFTTAFQVAKQQFHCRVWVFDDGLEPLTEADLDATFERLRQQAFSLFPIYRIANPASALLITKGTAMSPTLSDVRGSRFADNLELLPKQQTPIRTFCFVSDDNKLVLSPYLKTLAELSVLTLATGTTDELWKYSETHQFPGRADESDRIALPEAGIVIRETPGQSSQASVAPDHLARLFIYNHLLHQIGRQYFSKSYQTEALIQEAQRAHIVSPLSSLVVLETEVDYNRFGIKKDHSGLGNATLKQEGAVPEPHEWALLIMLAGLIGWVIWTKNYAIH